MPQITVNRPWSFKDFPIEVEGHRVSMGRAMHAIIRVELTKVEGAPRFASRLDQWIVDDLDRRGIAPRRSEFIAALRRYSGLR